MRRTRYLAAAALCVILAGCSRGAFTPTSLTPDGPARSGNDGHATARDTTITTTSTSTTAQRGGNAFGSGT